ncbi:MAG: HAD family hydrolase [Corynebacterium sp.]|nr:HAD family hydrolase [Corynebacterium sp.]
MSFSKKLIVSDLDGTLLGSNERISPRARAVLSRAHQDGVVVVLATGRPPRWVHPVIEQLDFFPLCVTGNGAVVYDSEKQTVLQSHLMDSETMFAVVEHAKKVLGSHVGFAVERLADDVFAPEHEHFAINEDFERVWPDFGEGIEPLHSLISRPAMKLLIRDTTRSAKEMAALLGTVPGAQFTYSIDLGLIEVSAAGVTKARTLNELAEKLKIDPADAIAFGDMPNDEAMLKWAGTGVAMGNAHPHVKSIADMVARTNDEDGLAEVLESLEN